MLAEPEQVTSDTVGSPDTRGSAMEVESFTGSEASAA
eukprot:CAMPEP_0171290042 /NCGR_PEP_ID=MMETSP0790-20130122/70934_1 /TAXON_ID=2925 /ORGANISM="Alexandrium catenella, Strain OF101" /LENGTH=36 /DNA_ID= /DNA_START= /DNA_END= /DNA_ORIENTATION=